MKHSLGLMGKLSLKHRRLIAISLVIVTLVVSTFGLSAQYSGHAQGDDTTVKGTVSAITGNVWTVNGIQISVGPSTTIIGYPVVGSTVTIVVVKASDGKM